MTFYQIQTLKLVNCATWYAEHGSFRQDLGSARAIFCILFLLLNLAVKSLHSAVGLCVNPCQDTDKIVHTKTVYYSLAEQISPQVKVYQSH